MSRRARKSLPRLIRLGLQVAAFVLLPTTLAWAQPPPLPGQAEPKSYVYQYFVVGLSFAMGLAMLYRPRKRTQDVERLPDDE